MMLNYLEKGNRLRRKREPEYDLSFAQSLVENNNYRASNRVRNYLINHGYDADGTVVSVVKSIRPDNYYKTDELYAFPGVYADIYRHIKFCNEEWYVKFYITGEGKAQLEIWSLNEDGYQH